MSGEEIFIFVFGLFVTLICIGPYLTYDLTNLATLQDWPWKMSQVDIVWGTFLCIRFAGITALVIIRLL